MLMKLCICTPEKILFDGKVKSVRLPSTLGPFEVLRTHAPVISTLEKGAITYKTAKDETCSFSVDKGVAEVEKNHVNVYLV